jgi:phage terminase large subunit
MGSRTTLRNGANECRHCEEVRTAKKSDEIIADSAEPKSIEEIRRAGFRIRPVAKGADSIRSGIDKLKSVQIMVHEDSVNVIRELRNYAWKRDYKTNQVTNQAEDDNNHAL